MKSWINDPRERQLLAAKLHNQYNQSRQKQITADENEELQKIDDLWKSACEDAKLNGKIRVCWLDLKTVSNRVYSFQSDYDIPLKELILDGIGLTSLENICQHCKDLTHLSLASNEIQEVSGIDNLIHISHMNLLRNNLTSLPSTIGLLVNLKKLELANNRLTTLPDCFGKLTQLKHINLEDNNLSELPVSFRKLKCEVVNLNTNNFNVFPDCLIEMPNLCQLSIMANQLIDLPVSIGRMKSFKVLKASKNRINIIPDSIVNLPSLEVLWLDFNKLSALPINFHHLIRLKVLKLEGNVDMIYPPLDVVVLGVEEVHRWSRQRVDETRIKRLRTIIQSLEEVLSLVKRHRIGGNLHEGLFRVNDGCYQIVPDALFNVFIPELRRTIWSNQDTTGGGITSFPFERQECEQALFQFRDAAGGIVRKLPNAMFRRCSCVSTGRSQVCVPPTNGYMCTRPALLIRMEVAYEENMKEKRRILEEERSIDDATKEATMVAKSFLTSEDGKMFIRDEAEKMLQQQQQDIAPTPSSQVKSIRKRIMTGLQSFHTQESAQLRQAEDLVKAEYIDKKVAAATESVLERNLKVQLIMKKWDGVSSDQVFQNWRGLIESSKRLERRKNRQRLKDERLQYEDKLAEYEINKLEVSIFPYYLLTSIPS